MEFFKRARSARFITTDAVPPFERRELVYGTVTCSDPADKRPAPPPARFNVHWPRSSGGDPCRRDLTREQAEEAALRLGTRYPSDDPFTIRKSK
jgi:hypothetical protein